MKSIRVKAPRAPKAKLRPTGYILYRGPSLINGAPIVVVAITKASKNSKTGNMVQTYILVDNGVSPVVNARTLTDVSICGDCKNRRGLGGVCYVNLGQGPRAVADGVNRGIYPADPAAAKLACTGRYVRLGTYGDPAAVPVKVWTDLMEHAADHTGYTHQWKTCSVELMQLVMASVDTPAERVVAKSKGYRTFRMVPAAEVQQGEFQCPASAEQGKRKTCAECRACDGGVDSRKADPVIVVHGSLKNRYRA